MAARNYNAQPRSSLGVYAPVSVFYEPCAHRRGSADQADHMDPPGELLDRYYN